MQKNQQSRQTKRASSGRRRSMWPLGLFTGVMVCIAAYGVPASVAAGDANAGAWYLTVLLQFATTATQTGWQVLGLATALLAAVVALVAFVGSRPATVLAQPKRESTQNVASWLLVMSTGLATIAATTMLLAPIFTVVFSENIDIASASAAASGQTQKALTAQINSIFIGFAGLGILVASWFLDQAVQAWDASDKDELAREITLVEARLAQREDSLSAARDAQSTQPDDSNPLALASVSTLLAAAAVAMMITIGLVAWRIVTHVALDITVFSSLIAFFAIAVAQSTIVVAAYWDWRTVIWNGPEVGEVDGAPQVLTSKWRRRRASKIASLVATGLVLPVLAVVATLATDAAETPGKTIVALILALVVFGVPTLAVVRPRGPRSWDAAVRASVIRYLSTLILADQQRRDELTPPATGVLRRLRLWLSGS